MSRAIKNHKDILEDWSFRAKRAKHKRRMQLIKSVLAEDNADIIGVLRAPRGDFNDSWCDVEVTQLTMHSTGDYNWHSSSATVELYRDISIEGLLRNERSIHTD